MFINLLDDKWVETDNITTLEVYEEHEDAEECDDIWYELGLRINGDKIKLFHLSLKNDLYEYKDDIDNDIRFETYERLKCADEKNLKTLYERIIYIKTKGKDNKKVVSKGKIGKKRPCLLVEQNKKFESISEAAIFVNRFLWCTGECNVLDTYNRIKDCLNETYPLACGFHFDEY